MIRPLGNRIVCDVDAPETTTKGGLVLPENVLVGKPWTGTVLAVGPKLEDEIGVGDKVMFPYFAGVKVEHQDERVLVILREDEIIASEKMLTSAGSPD